MADLGQLLGTLLASLAHARRIADEETAAIAEYYRTNPLLEGMSLPRVRVPELVIDLPLLIQDHIEGEPSQLEEDHHVRQAVNDALKKAATREGIKLTKTQQDSFDRELKTELAKFKDADAPERGHPRELVVKAVDTALTRSLGDEKISQTQMRRLSFDVRQRASDVALKKPGQPAKITASMITSEIKENAGANNVTRLKIVLREEGLEWSTGENADGTVSRKLIPE